MQVAVVHDRLKEQPSNPSKLGKIIVDMLKGSILRFQYYCCQNVVRCKIGFCVEMLKVMFVNCVLLDRSRGCTFNLFFSFLFCLQLIGFPYMEQTWSLALIINATEGGIRASKNCRPAPQCKLRIKNITVFLTTTANAKHCTSSVH